jgi:uncharacterized protein (TIGR02996 family)
VKKRAEPPPLQYVRHTGSPAWGVGVLVRESYDQRTYLFADGIARTFKTALVAKLIEPTDPPGDADRARLERGVAAVSAGRDTPSLGASRGNTATPKAVHLDIEAQIREARDDDSPYLVYADWLQAKSDPRGQLIVAQHQLSLDPDNKQLREAERALFSAHGNYFMPPTLGKLAAARRKGDPDATTTEVVWRCGYIDRARLARKTSRQPELEAALAELLSHPSAQFLRSVTLGALGTTTEFNYIAMMDAIARTRAPQLEELVIGAFTPEQMELAFSRTGDLSPTLAALPGLRRLVVRSGSVRFANAVKHGNLRELSIVAAELSEPNLRKLVKLAMPALVAFELEVPELRLDAKTFVANKNLAKLRKLALRRTVDTGAVLEAIVKAPFVGTLEELDLSGGDLSDAAAIQIVQYAARLRDLRRLALDGNRISPAALARIQAAVATASAAPQNQAELAMEAVIARAPDAASVAAARRVAQAADWLALGRDGDRLWGEYEGRTHYWVWTSVSEDRAGCDCMSPKQPCKHALALLFLLAAQHPFPQRRIPEVIVRRAATERPRYGGFWE